MTEAPQNLRQIEIPKVAKNPIKKVKRFQKDCELWCLTTKTLALCALSKCALYQLYKDQIVSKQKLKFRAYSGVVQSL